MKGISEDQKAVNAAAELVKAGNVVVSRGEQASSTDKLKAVQAYVDSLVAGKEVKSEVVAGTTAGEYKVTLTKGEATADKTVKVTFGYEADDRFVTEVNALNATQVEVKFSVAVDKNDIDGKVSIQGVKFSSGALSADGKTLH